MSSKRTRQISAVKISFVNSKFRINFLPSFVNDKTFLIIYSLQLELFVDKTSPLGEFGILTYKNLIQIYNYKCESDFVTLSSLTCWNDFDSFRFGDRWDPGDEGCFPKDIIYNINGKIYAPETLYKSLLVYLKRLKRSKCEICPECFRNIRT